MSRRKTFFGSTSYLVSENNNNLLVFIPGISGGISSNRFDGLIRRALNNEYDFLAIQVWKDGEDFGKRSFRTLVSDVASKIDMVSSQYSSISMVGKSFGGTIALCLTNPKIKHKVLWAPFLRSTKSSIFPKKADDVVVKGIPEKYLRITNQEAPVSIIHGTSDRVSSLASSTLLIKVMKLGTLHTIRGGDHGFKGKQTRLLKLTFQNLKGN